MFVTAIKVMGDSGKEYAIDTDSEGNPRCTCPSFSHSPADARTCKHLVYVREFWLKRPRRAADRVGA